MELHAVDYPFLWGLGGGLQHQLFIDVHSPAANVWLRFHSGDDNAAVTAAEISDHVTVTQSRDCDHAVDAFRTATILDVTSSDVVNRFAASLSVQMPR
jgi:hypothetical protein